MLISYAKQYELMHTLIEIYGSQAAVAKALKIRKQKFHYWYTEAKHGVPLEQLLRMEALLKKQIENKTSFEAQQTFHLEKSLEARHLIGNSQLLDTQQLFSFSKKSSHALPHDSSFDSLLSHSKVNQKKDHAEDYVVKLSQQLSNENEATYQYLLHVGLASLILFAKHHEAFTAHSSSNELQSICSTHAVINHQRSSSRAHTSHKRGQK